MPTYTTKQRFKKIAITTGDTNGVGFEVTAKALKKISTSADSQKALFFVFRDARQETMQPSLFKILDKTWTRVTFFSLETALEFAKNLTPYDQKKNKYLIDLSLKSSAADWVFLATSACIQKRLDSLVTAPLSKTLIKRSGYSQIGHTGIFRSFFPNASLHMSFVGKYFNIVLATDHIPLADISSTLTQKKFKSALSAALSLKKSLSLKKEVAVLGLNPHAGEEGLLGKKELFLFNKLPKGFVGPLVPDAAFLKKNWSQYSVFLCLYHDQGLIPFKMQHGQDSGVHITLGLPFVRTSVDHGTAFDIYNKNLANPHSMLDAICLNLKLLEK